MAGPESVKNTRLPQRTKMPTGIASLLMRIIAFALSGMAMAQPAPPTLAPELARTVTARMASDKVPGVVIGLIEGGVPVWTGAFGLADPSTGRAMREDALWRVESISKPVTAWGAMRLAEAGRLDLDAPAADCLLRWAPPDAGPAFSARQLLSHEAGIGLGDFNARYAPAQPRPDLPTHLAEDFSRIGAPASGFAYSDSGFNLVELMIEDCTGEDFADWMAREVLRPLGMTGASFDWTGVEMPVGHELRGRPVAPYVYPARASGGLHATLADITRFAEASMTGATQPVLSAQAVAELHRPRVAVGGLFGFAADGYGLGHFTETLSDGRAAVWHGGQGYGWMTHLHMVPETGDGIVILANSQRAWPLFAEVLAAWSEHLGVAPVGMARVLWAETAARFAIGALILLAAAALLAGLRRRAGRGLRITAGLLALPLVGLPVWAALQDYLFVFSILPRLAAPLGWAMTGAGVVLAFLSLAAGQPNNWRPR